MKLRTIVSLEVVMAKSTIAMEAIRTFIFTAIVKKEVTVTLKMKTGMKWKFMSLN